MPGNYNQIMSGFSVQNMNNNYQLGLNANQSQKDINVNNPFYIKQSKENMIVNSMGQNNMNINQINMNIMNQNQNNSNMVQNSLNNNQNNMNMNQNNTNMNMNMMNQNNINNNMNNMNMNQNSMHLNQNSINMNQNNMNMNQNSMHMSKNTMNMNQNSMKMNQNNMNMSQNNMNQNNMNMNQNNTNMMNQNNMNIMNNNGMNNMNNNNMMGINSLSANNGIGMGLNLSNNNSQMQIQNNTFSKNMNPNNMNLLNNMNMNNNMNNNFNNNNNNMNNMNNFGNMSNMGNNNNNNFNQINTNLINPNNMNNMNKNNNQNNNEQNILNDICNTHTLKLSKYYDYKPTEATVHLNNLLKDMDNFGEITKKNIEQEKASNPTKFLSLQEAFSYDNNNQINQMNNNMMNSMLNNGMMNSMFNNNMVNDPKNDYFVCALLKLALDSQGCTCEIEKVDSVNNLTENEKKEAFTAIQFITNGMYKYKKYILSFDFGEEKNNVMINDLIVQNNFNIKLQKALTNIFNITFKDIILTNPRKSPYIISAVIKKSTFNELPDIQLYNTLKTNYGFDTIIKVEKTILLNGCKLNRVMLDCLGDRNVGWGMNEMRGGKPYTPPMGWMGYGIKVLNRFDGGDNIWLDFNNTPGEWAVAYHGMGSSLSGEINNNNNLLDTIMRQKFKKSNDKYNSGKTVGEGVYMTPFPNVMENFCSVYNYQGKKYKIGIMCRVKPDKIRCPVDGDNFWVINGTDNEVRPYRILIKEIM